jgi:hypothetical protein
MQPSQNEHFFFNLEKFHQKKKLKNPKFENQAVWKVLSVVKSE